MDQIFKFKSISKSTADAAADIDLINKYSKKDLTPNDVYVYSIGLCDNDRDRDDERFVDKTLEKLAPMFLGKSGLSDHRWSSKEQHSRIYRTEIEKNGQKNTLGEPLAVLRADAYMLKTDDTQPMIDAIEGGILKEVSVGLRVSECNCSICKKPLKFDWRTWTEQCETGHIKGQTYDGKLCIGDLENPTDAFEYSFVAVPAQKRAGVIKSVESIPEAIEYLRQNAAELPQYAKELKGLFPAIQTAFTSADEREKRAKIAEDAKAQLKSQG